LLIFQVIEDQDQYINEHTKSWTLDVSCAFRDGRVDRCPAQLYAVVVCLFILLSGVCALSGYTYYVHARLDALYAICTKLELSTQLVTHIYTSMQANANLGVLLM